MAVDWSSLDVHLDLPPGAPGTALADALRGAVRSGRLRPGAALPSTRALAADLGIARGTVSTVYSRLAAEGYLVTAQGAATRVAGTGAPVAAGRPVPEQTGEPARWDFRTGLPDLGGFPRKQWLAAARTALSTVSAADLGFPYPAGHPALRAALADYLGRARGVVAEPDRIVVCAGYVQALGAVAAVLAARGAREAAFEDPSLPDFRHCAADAGLRPVPVGVDEGGLRVDEVSAPLVVVTAAHQFPLGVPLEPARRAALAGRVGVTVLEDDYDGEFRYAGPKVGALQALAPERVVYAGTASKTLAPGLRFAWLVLPRELVAPVRERLQRARAMVSVLEQLTLAEFIRSGGYDSHVRRCRTVYRRRRAALLAAVRELPVVPQGVPAGLHVVLGLPCDEDRVTAALARAGVGAQPLGEFWWGSGPRTPGLVVGYGAPAQHAFGPGLRALAGALASATR